MSSRTALRPRVATFLTLHAGVLAAMVAGLVVLLTPPSQAAAQASQASQASQAVAQASQTSASAKKKRKKKRTQRATISVLPPIAQVGSVPAASTAAQTVISATFSPASEGRPLVLARKQRGRWKTVARAELTASGRVEFTARSRVRSKPAKYRVTALPHQRLRRHSTGVVRTNAWGAPDFVDEFATLDSRWSQRQEFYNPWGGRSCSKGGGARTAAIENGALRLSVLPDLERAEPCYTYDEDGNALGAVPYRYRLNGHVSTQHSADFLYGVAAARMKLHEGRGQHASFWLQPRGLLPVGNTPWGAEIDVVEWFGSEDRKGSLMTNIYRPTPHGTKERIGNRFGSADEFLADRSDAWWKNYHVFSVEWTPSEYIFRIDGKETWRTDQGISHHPQFLILSLLSSDYELAHNPEAYATHTYVDWVQFWER